MGRSDIKGRGEYESLKRENLIQEAVRLENRASHLRKIGASSEEIGLTYLDAGDLRRKAKDFVNTRNDYLDASRYGFPYNTKVQAEINKHLNQVEKEHALFEFIKGRKDLGSRLHAILSIGFLASALFFVSSSLTGNVIAGLVPNNSRFVGICFFACGLIFAFLYSRCRMKTKTNKSKTKNKKRKK